MNTLMNIVKGIFNEKAKIEAIIETQVFAYKSERKYNPDKDPHYWLSKVFISRYNQSDEIEALASTILHSCISEPDNAEALGLYFIFKESKDLLSKYPEFIQKYNDLMKDVLEMKENNPTEILRLYESKNPITSKDSLMKNVILRMLELGSFENE